MKCRLVSFHYRRRLFVWLTLPGWQNQNEVLNPPFFTVALDVELLGEWFASIASPLLISDIMGE